MHKIFTILQISSGWFMGEINNGQDGVLFDASYLTNFPDDFMRALLYALGRWPQDERSVCSFTMDSEPIVTDWEITTVEDYFVFRTSEYDPDRFRDCKTEKVLRIPIRSFLKDFLSEYNSVLNRFGLYGYRCEWGYEFPLSLFLQLSDIYNDSSEIVSTIGDDVENSGLKHKSVDFEKELSYLKSKGLS